MMDITELAQRIAAAPRKGQRRLVALAGPPASGKSTLSDSLAKAVGGQVVPMDGFHLDNTILRARGLLDRKGAPETFDAHGVVHLIARLASEPEVIHPIFDRTRDIAIAGAGLVQADCDTVVVEGNYLLHDAPIWRELQGMWDISIQLDVPIPVLRERLIARWLTHGLTEAQAAERAEGNDLRNASVLAAASLPADITISS